MPVFLGWAVGAVGFTYSATSPMRAITSGDFSVTDFGFTEILALLSKSDKSLRWVGRDIVTTSPDAPALAVLPER